MLGQLLLGQEAPGHPVHGNFGQIFFMSEPSPGVLIHFVDQFGHRRFTVSDHMCRRSFGGGHEFVADYQQPEIISLDTLFHDHPVGTCICRFKRSLCIFHRVDADGGALAVVAIHRFHNHRESDPVHRPFNFIFGRDHIPVGNRTPVVVQHILGFVFIVCDFKADTAGFTGNRGLDSLLVDPPAKLYKGIAVET